MTRVLVLSDTHLHPARPRRLPDVVWSLVDSVDHVLHAGDVCTPELLEALAERRPTTAVLGNNDHALVGILPLTRTVELGGVRIGMIHDSGPRGGRAGRMRRRFPDADVVVFGHSHDPVCETGLDGQLLVNPGSPTERRRAPRHTVGVLELVGGRVVDARHVVVDAGHVDGGGDNRR
jgi:putative phosphoesterase